MKKRLGSKPCRICGTDIPGRKRADRNAYYYPCQCDACHHKWRPDIPDHRAEYLAIARRKLEVPIGTRRKHNASGFMYWVIKTENGWEYEHRRIMETALGRQLARSEHVHHRNKNGLDNEPDNLTVITSAEHAREHHSLPPTQWSRNYAACIVCGESSRAHAGSGRCTRCWQRNRAAEIGWPS